MSKVEITRQELRELQRAQAKLAALEQGGVDNWEGYDFALERLNKEQELEKAVEALAVDLLTVLSSHAYEPSERGAGIAFHKEAQEAFAADLLKFIKERLQ